MFATLLINSWFPNSCADTSASASSVISVESISPVIPMKFCSDEGRWDWSEGDNKISWGSYLANKLASCDSSILWMVTSPVLISITEKP